MEHICLNRKYWVYIMSPKNYYNSIDMVVGQGQTLGNVFKFLRLILKFIECQFKRKFWY